MMAGLLFSVVTSALPFFEIAGFLKVHRDDQAAGLVDVAVELVIF